MRMTIFVALFGFVALAACGCGKAPLLSCTATTETKEDFCARMAAEPGEHTICGEITAENFCGVQVTFDCESTTCPPGLFCGPGMVCNVACAEESQEQFCARMAEQGKECGDITAERAAGLLARRAAARAPRGGRAAPPASASLWRSRAIPSSTVVRARAPRARRAVSIQPRALYSSTARLWERCLWAKRAAPWASVCRARSAWTAIAASSVLSISTWSRAARTRPARQSTASACSGPASRFPESSRAGSIPLDGGPASVR